MVVWKGPVVLAAYVRRYVSRQRGITDMAFNPDTDVNYQAFLAARAKLSGPDADFFTDQFIQYMANQCTLTATSNAALITAAITAAKTAVRRGVGVAPSDANYVGARNAVAKFNGN